MITSNLPFGEWGTVFQGERMTAALLDRLTHRCHIFEMNGESYRFRESMKAKTEKAAKAKKETPPTRFNRLKESERGGLVLTLLGFAITLLRPAMTAFASRKIAELASRNGHESRQSHETRYQRR